MAGDIGYALRYFLWVVHYGLRAYITKEAFERSAAVAAPVVHRQKGVHSRYVRIGFVAYVRV